MSHTPNITALRAWARPARAAVDLTPYVTSAADATILWPLPNPPDDPGWHLRAPLSSSSGFSKLSVGPEDQSTELGQSPQ